MKLDAFFSQYKQTLLKQGDILISANENPSGIFFLKKGLVKVYTITKNGDELVLNTFKDLSFFPMSWALTEKKNEYFYEAVTDVEVYKAPKEEIIKFLENNADVLLDLLRRVYIGTNGLLTRMSYLMSANAHVRLIGEIILYIERFKKDDLQKNNETEINITEKELASLTGLTRETVSRELRVLKNKGLITFARRTLVVLDINNLKNELTSLS